MTRAELKAKLTIAAMVRRRRELGVTQEELARRLKTSQATISRMETGAGGNVAFALWTEWLEVLGIDAQRLAACTEAVISLARTLGEAAYLRPLTDEEIGTLPKLEGLFDFSLAVFLRHMSDAALPKLEGLLEFSRAMFLDT
jgi:transcriptional regulator with XRE-family HTH domain